MPSFLNSYVNFSRKRRRHHVGKTRSIACQSIGRRAETSRAPDNFPHVMPPPFRIKINVGIQKRRHPVFSSFDFFVESFCSCDHDQETRKMLWFKLIDNTKGANKFQTFTERPCLTLTFTGFLVLPLPFENFDRSAAIPPLTKKSDTGMLKYIQLNFTTAVSHNNFSPVIKQRSQLLIQYFSPAPNKKAETERYEQMKGLRCTFLSHQEITSFCFLLLLKAVKHSETNWLSIEASSHFCMRRSSSSGVK